jgi:hypothetical protein
MKQASRTTLPQTDAKLQLDITTLRNRFDREAFGFEHNLSKLDLFRDESLQQVAHAMSRAPRDYFIAGSASSPGTSFYSVPNGGLSPPKAMQNLDHYRCRILLKRPENHDRRFRDLLQALFQQVLDTLGGLHGQRIARLESGIFISSGRTVTPVHFDPEMAFFSQISGAKIYHIYPPGSVGEPDLERFYIRGRNDIGNVDLNTLDPAGARTFDLEPGMGLHQPQNAPHWVETGESVSVSYTFLFQTNVSRAASRARALNYCMRRVGLRPSPLGVHPASDAAKAEVMRLAKPVQSAGKVWNKLKRVVGGKRLA